MEQLADWIVAYILPVLEFCKHVIFGNLLGTAVFAAIVIIMTAIYGKIPLELKDNSVVGFMIIIFVVTAGYVGYMYLA